MRYSLYPHIEPNRDGLLEVSDRHTMYWEEVGNPQGRPILFVHGGPGSGVNSDSRRYFDPKHYRIILFDQRGCGRSTPHADLVDNTTWHLVADIEKLREHLGIKQWIVFGGSWGSTLSLAYAEAHPDRVLGLILRGIFLCRRKEIAWLYQEGASYLFPEEWEKYLYPIPLEERHDMVTAYYRQLTSPSREVQLAAARTWSVWEGATSTLLPNQKLVSRYAVDDFAIAFARIECHYFINNAFLHTDDQLLSDAHRIRHIPCEIVHGRYDVVCPIDNAWQLHKVLPHSELHIIADAGHSAVEPGIENKLVEITERFKQL